MWILKDQAEIKTHELGDYWASKIDGSILCLVGEEDRLKFLEGHGISLHIQNHKGDKHSVANMGYSPFAKRWFGWVDYRIVCNCGVDTVKNDEEKQSRWETFGFDGAFNKVKEYLS